MSKILLQALEEEEEEEEEADLRRQVAVGDARAVTLAHGKEFHVKKTGKWFKK